MRYSGGLNVFMSHFVIGSRYLPTSDVLDDAHTLYKWMHFKDTDWGMSRYTTGKTQFISFPHIFPLSDLEDIFRDLIRIYKKEFPFSEKSDWIDFFFDYTLDDLKWFIDTEFTFYGPSPIDKDPYYFFYRDIGEIVDFLVDSDKGIDYYKQYYKRVISLINNIEYGNEPTVLIEKELSFENNFDHISTDEVYSFFKKELVEKNYLSEEDLHRFLTSAFHKCKPPKKRFKINGSPTRKKIRSVFYKFYEEVASKPYGQQRRYAELLGEYFEGYKTKNVQSNFSKNY